MFKPKSISVSNKFYVISKVNIHIKNVIIEIEKCISTPQPVPEISEIHL